jgi:hypothetical protein
MSNDWFPTRRDDIIHMTDTWLGQHGLAWSVPPDQITALQNLSQQGKTLLAEVKSGGRSPVNTEQCRETFKALETAMRFLHGNYFNSPPRTGDERVALLLHVRDSRPTPIPPPDAVPGLTLHHTDGHGMLIKLFMDAAPSDRRSADHFFGKWGLKPPGRWATPEEAAADPRLLTRPPSRADDLPMHFSTRRKTHTLPFSLSDIGMELYVCACWQTPGNEDGPYCSIQSKLIS